ncbi:MFS transporter [Mucilaginibacter ginsenosidivorax]|uniref:Multidrug effflux MFS transporter n=1 Tax=Mucilaginibacter ginsenosidivorax TaxID=862126 RepID=A0A5B8VTK4_9SPHI|nr:MFS transporter [Mucilaginibacter ginsenosidivorax]QEC74770.1 multidrug effflux MFS transporter [Mucilaginibacter ginsenosidivorax]
MKIIKEHHRGISTILAFALIPLSGFATDIYIPSLPSMATHLGVTNAAVQLSLIVFMVSSGISQLFVGSLLDSFGRYRLGTISLLVFALASISIALSHSIQLIYAMRVLQGITVALIVVGKRAYFMDTYTGEKLKHYTSLFSIIWATAPIVAPFIGGYLETAFGWQANFYFLGIATLALFVLELVYSGESLKNYQPFKAKSILQVYWSTLSTLDFSLGLVMISLSYAMLIVYGMSSPFIIEHVFHLSPVVTGYCSLLSGVSLMTGGVISKTLIKKPLLKKVWIAIALQTAFAALMIVASAFKTNLVTLMMFTAAVHLLSGFVFNNIFAYCLGRFSKNAGIASGVTGGSLYIITSVFSYGIVNVIAIKNQEFLGIAYLTFAVLACITFALFVKVSKRHQAKQETAMVLSNAVS